MQPAELSTRQDIDLHESADLIGWEADEDRWHLRSGTKWRVEQSADEQSIFIHLRHRDHKVLHPVWEIRIAEKICFYITDEDEVPITSLPSQILKLLQHEHCDLVNECMAAWRSTRASAGKRPTSPKDDPDDDFGVYDDDEYTDDPDNTKDENFDPENPNFDVKQAWMPSAPSADSQDIEQTLPVPDDRPTVGGKAPRKMPRPQTGGKQPRVQPSRESHLTELEKILESVNDCSSDSLDPVDQYIEKLNRLVYNRRSADDSNFNDNLQSAMSVTTHLDKMISSLTSLRQRVAVNCFKAFQKIGKQKGKRKQQLADIIDFVDTNKKKKKSPNN